MCFWFLPTFFRGLSHGRRGASDRGRGDGAHSGPVSRRRTLALADARRIGDDEVGDASGEEKP